MSNDLTRSSAGRVDSTFDALARSLASRYSRRSFLGRVGATGVAASVGTTAFALFQAQPAAAVLSDYCANVMGTTYCDTTYGCYCGCWSVGSCSFCDCCDKGSWCSSHGGCKNSNGLVTCCNSKQHPGQGCGVSTTKIICRDVFC